MNAETAARRHACVRGALFCGALFFTALLSVGSLSASAEQTPSDAARQYQMLGHPEAQLPAGAGGGMF